MKEFLTNGKVEVDESKSIESKVDGRPVTFYEVTPEQGAIMMMLLQSAEDDPATAGTFIQMFFELMDPDSAKWLRKRLMDRTDSFTLEGEGGIVDIFEELMEEWSAHPTKQRAVSPPRRRVTGTASTAPTRVKASRSAVSP